jgi:hypothetical protein
MEFDMSQPTAEELEQEEKKREESVSKSSTKKDTNKKSGANNENTKKFDPTKTNRAIGNSVKAEDSRPNSAPTTINPSPNGTRPTQAPPGVKGQKPTDAKMGTPPANNKLNSQLQNVELSNNTEFSAEVPPKTLEKRANNAVASPKQK